MSFGGTVRRGKRGARSTGARTEGAGLANSARSPGNRSYRTLDEEAEIDWIRVAVFATGIALGAVAGAGVALLFAPSSGAEVRAAIARRGARLAFQGRDAWDDLRDELQWAARRGKRRVGRRVQQARWAAEDFIDDRRRPGRSKNKRREEEKTDARPETDIDDRDIQEIVDSLC